MKFRMTELTYPYPYPYDYKIELIEYGLVEREKIADWLTDLNVPCNMMRTGVLYLRKKEAVLFLLRWA